MYIGKHCLTLLSLNCPYKLATSESRHGQTREVIGKQKESQVSVRHKILRPKLNRAADWDVNQFLWKGRMRIVAKGDKAIINLEDATSGPRLPPPNSMPHACQ